MGFESEFKVQFTHSLIMNICEHWHRVLYICMDILKSFLLCRLMKAQTLGDTTSLEFMRGRRILEINPDHPIIKDLNVRFFYLMLVNFCRDLAIVNP